MKNRTSQKSIKSIKKAKNKRKLLVQKGNKKILVKCKIEIKVIAIKRSEIVLKKR